MTPTGPQHQRRVDHDGHDASPSDDGQSVRDLTQESYYTNQDIAVLHAIVAAAQEQLDHASGIKPLPAAALFKAYDQVLPNYGIDPDLDHHLSAFVFRVGGERGGGTLVDKLQAILNRMGILLEFGDGNTVSVRTSRSPSVSVNQSPSRHPPRPQRPQLSEDTLPGRPVPLLSSSSTLDQWAINEYEDSPPAYEMEQAMLGARRAAAAAAMGRWRTAAVQNQNPQDIKPPVTSLEYRQVRTSPQDVGKPSLQQVQGKQRGPPQSTTPRSALLAVMDRWRDSSAQRPQNYQDDTRSNHGDQTDKAEDVAQVWSGSPATEQNSGLLIQEDQRAHPLQGQALTTMAGRMNTITEHRTEEELQGFRAKALSDSLQTPNPKTEAVAEKAEHDRLMKRAARAREIYVASRAFNHWADRTARRLEREAVARRHMIRFRCFRGWSQAPNSRSPVVDQLRVTTAVQKLQRAVADQEEQLRVAAKAICQELRLKTIRRVIDRWMGHLTEHMVRQRAATRAKAKTLSSWIQSVSSGVALSDSVAAQTRLRDEIDALRKWNDQSQRGALKSEAARKIGASHLCMTDLRVWWDQAELERRAQAYRTYLVAGKASMVFERWNLRARAQAYTWRNDYLTVTRVFDSWLQQAQYGVRKRDEARRIFVERSRVKFLGHLSRASQEESRLSYIQRRACLFISGTRLLGIMDGALKSRKEREWHMARRQVMMRYQQFSSDRKKRNFLGALDRWRAAAARGRDEARLVETSRMAYDMRTQVLALAKWWEEADEAQQRQSRAHIHYAQTHLAQWRAFSDLHVQSDMQAWGIWAEDRQRQSLKQWSIASLQQGGHAHTASKLRQRHERGKRKRTIDQWQRGSDGSHKAGRELHPSFALSSRPAGSHRSSWSAPSSWRPPRRSIRDGQEPPLSPMATPTRSTGLRLPMGSILSSRPMPPVREADEDVGDKLSSRDGVQSTDSPPRAKIKALSVADLPSTTPRAPVPTYLDRQLPSQYRRPSQHSQSSVVRIRRGNIDNAEAEAETPAFTLPRRNEGARHSASVLSRPPNSVQPGVVKPGSARSTRSELFAPITKTGSHAATRSWGPQHMAHRASAPENNRPLASQAVTAQLSPRPMLTRPSSSQSQSLPAGK